MLRQEIFLLSLIAALAACNSRPNREGAVASELERPLGSTAADARARSAESAPAPPGARSGSEDAAAETTPSSLPERLARELARRPAQAIRGEDLVAALVQQEVDVLRTRQVLATPIGARYCTLLESAHGVGASVCEFSDASGARAGAELSRARFDALLPGRLLVARESTLLTVTKAADPRAEAEAARIVRAFATLRPRPLRQG
jgi:hypothetical protein